VEHTILGKIGARNIHDIISNVLIFTYTGDPDSSDSLNSDQFPFPVPFGSHFKVIFVLLCKKQTYEYIHWFVTEKYETGRMRRNRTKQL